MLSAVTLLSKLIAVTSHKLLQCQERRTSNRLPTKWESAAFSPYVREKAACKVSVRKPEGTGALGTADAVVLLYGTLLFKMALKTTKMFAPLS